MTEWRPIAGFEGIYEISADGQVRSLDRTVVDSRGQERKRKGKIMYRWARDGMVMLSRGGEQAPHRVSDLLANAFPMPRSDGDR